MQPRVRMTGWAGRVFVTVFVALLLGCAGSERAPLTGGPLAGLPPLPLDVPGHSVAATETNTLLGREAIARSLNAFEQGDNLVLVTLPGGIPPALEWGIWRYTPDTGVNEVVEDIEINMEVTGGNNAWLAVANYGEVIWEFAGPFTQGGGGLMRFDNLHLGNYLSPGGNVYVLAAVFDGSSASVSGLDFTSTVDDPEPLFSISGRVVDTDTTQGIAGLTITLNPGNMTDTTDNLGNYSFDNLSAGLYDIDALTIPDYDVSPLGGYSGISVGPDSTGNNFDATPIDPPQVTYTNTMKALFDQSTNPLGSCTECHGSSIQWAGRRFDTYQNAKTHASAGLTEVKRLSGWMPDGKDRWSDADIAKFQEWVDNGTPE